MGGFFAGVAVAALVFGLIAFAREVAKELRRRRIALHGARPGANSREPVRENVIAVLHSDGRAREIH